VVKEPTPETPVPTRRAILLGASNAVRGLSTAIETAQNAWGTPLEVMAAIGHGRSYGQTSRVLGRALPGIMQSRLWEALQQRPSLPTAALVTDIGNDIVYGQEVEQIVQWLEICLQRLQPLAQRLVVTRLPLETIAEIPAWKFRLLISLIYPTARVDHAQALAKAEQLDQHIVQFAGRYGAYVVHPDSEWYGWDPIHVTRAHQSAAWRKYLSYWSDGRAITPARPSWRCRLMPFWARPAQWSIFGVERRREQPTARFRNGTALSLY
jgi:hypothetical protein